MAESSNLILNRMLRGCVYDTSVGSIMYDLHTTNAIEYATLQEQGERILDSRFVETATGDDLTLACADRGVYRKAFTFSNGYVLVKGIAGTEILKGDLVASGTITFSFIENAKIPESGQLLVKVECTESGALGNALANTIVSFPKTIIGLHSVTNPEPFENGYDLESDEELKERYYLKVRNENTYCNDNAYILWSREVQGVANARVQGNWNGLNTVKVTIISSDKTGASEELIKNTWEHIEELRPICVDVTVVSAIEKLITIDVNISIDSDKYTLENVKAEIKENIRTYIKDCAFKSKYISYAKVGAIILDTNGVSDYDTLKLNNTISNINVDDNEVAVLGGVNFG